MTSRTITNTTITGGYTLANGVSSLTISPTGVITGGSVGVLCPARTAIVNRGLVINSSAVGVELTAGGSLINGSSAFTTALVESSGVGVYVNSASVTITNFATISGATAVKFTSASDVLIVEAGSALIGAVQGGHGTLQMALGAGTLSSLGSSFNGFGYYAVQSGGSWTLDGSNALGSATTLVNHGTLLVNGSLADSGDVDNAGSLSGTAGVAGAAGGTAIVLTGGALRNGAVTAGGSLGGTGTVTGGAGGAGGAGGTAVAGAYGALTTYPSSVITGGAGGAGGAGGTGVSLAFVTNAGSIVGGAGGNGASYKAVGGAGGAGARIGAYGTLTNKGAITGGAGGAGGGARHTGGAGGVGVYLAGHDTLINGAQATIAAGAGGASGGVGGVAGVVLQGPGTVVNYGVISGATWSVDMTGTGGVLVAKAGSRLVGAAQGGGGALELANGVGTITGLGATGTISGADAMSFSGFGSYRFDSGTNWSLVGTNSVGAGISLADNGRVESSGSLIVSGTIGGAGTLAIDGGVATIAQGASVTVANLAINAGAVNLDASLTSQGTFALASQAILTLGSGDELLLSGASQINGLIVGGGTVTVQNSTIYGLAIAGATELVDAGYVAGGGLAIDGGVAGGPSLVIDPGATWAFVRNSNILNGSPHAYISVEGTFASSLPAHSTIECPMVDTGLIEARTGTLGLDGSLTGSGALQVDAGATLAVASSAAPTLTANLAAGSANAAATLSLQNQSSFAGVIACHGAYDIIDIAGQAAFTGAIRGFANKDTIDLLGVVATSATINAQDQLVVIYENAGTVKPVISLQMSGQYAGEVFSVRSQKTGGVQGSVITVSPGATPQWTTQTISSLQSGGVVLASKYDELDITGAGVVRAGSSPYGVLSSYGARIFNDGSVVAGSAFGVDLQTSGYVTNGSVSDKGATIQGGVGVYVKHGFATVTNFGTIAGGSGVAVEFVSTHGRLIAEAGSVLVGAVQGGGGTLELAGGTGAITGLGATGTVSGAEAMTFSGFGAYQLDAGSSWTLNGTDTLGSGVVLTSAGSLTISGALGGTGTLAIAGGVATIGGRGMAKSLWLEGGTTYLDRSLTIKGANAFSEGPSAVLALGAGVSLSLSGATSLHGLIYGAGSVTMGNGGVVSALALDDGATLDVSGGVVTENNGLSIGGPVGKAGVVIGQAATWVVGYGLNLQAGSVGAFMEVYGKLEGQCVNGTVPEKSSLGFGLSVTATGTVEAQAGPLTLLGPVTGTGLLKVDGGATLTTDVSVASTLKVSLAAGTTAAPATFVIAPFGSFGGTITCGGSYDAIDLGAQAAFGGVIAGFGANDTLALDPNGAFTGAIDGFGVGGVIDLLQTAANGASINAQDQLVIVEGAATVATIQLTGSYSGATFTFASDGAHGTNVTLMAAAATPTAAAAAAARPVLTLVTAMAAMGPAAGPSAEPPAHAPPWKPTLWAPRPQLA